MNRPLRTRMMGSVGGEGETPPATRLDRVADCCDSYDLQRVFELEG